MFAFRCSTEEANQFSPEANLLTLANYLILLIYCDDLRLISLDAAVSMKITLHIIIIHFPYTSKP